MQDNGYFKGMFTIAAIWNWSVALLFMTLAILNMEQLGLFLKIFPQNYLGFISFLGSLSFLELDIAGLARM